MTLERVVVPVDFSDDAKMAARLALAFAGWDHAQLCLVHVDPFPDPTAVPSADSRLWRAVEAHHIRRLELEVARLRKELVRRGSAGVEVSAALRRGRPAEGICDFASEWDADLLVLGAHGASGAVRYLFGSVSAQVARRAPCPVLVTRPGRSQELGRAGRFHRALVAIDYSAFSMPCVDLAGELLHPTGAVEALHVWHPPAAIDAEPGYREAAEARRAAEETALAAFLEHCDTGALEVSSRVQVGSPAHAILDEARRFLADVVVLGSHGQHGLFEHVIGTVADRVLRHADAPVLLMPQRALRREELRRRFGPEEAAPQAG